MSLTAAGVLDFVEMLRRGRYRSDECAKLLDYAWLQSVLDTATLSDPVLATFDTRGHNRTVTEFKAGDRDHIQTTAQRIRRLCAERAVRARDEFPEQAQLVERQANLKRRHMPVRTFFHGATDVLLALKPCWVMSPLTVSQLLPPKTYFDVVIFDEASQITPADAVSSILRGKQLVVAGDQKQLPPTSFFASETSDDYTDPDDAEVAPVVAGTSGFESILDALSSMLNFRMLRWHYRSHDERLIAFSNAHIYDRMLTTFPGITGSECLQHVLVPWESGADTNSPSAEVNAVVDLIIEHALKRPGESLGVIAMGIKHANRIDEALRQRLQANPSLLEEVVRSSTKIARSNSLQRTSNVSRVMNAMP